MSPPSRCKYSTPCVELWNYCAFEHISVLNCLCASSPSPPECLLDFLFLSFGGIRVIRHNFLLTAQCSALEEITAVSNSSDFPELHVSSKVPSAPPSAGS